MMRIWMAVGLLAAVSSLLFFHFARDFPWRLAMLSAVSVGGLVFVTLQTITRLRSQLQQFDSSKRARESD